MFRKKAAETTEREDTIKIARFSETKLYYAEFMYINIFL